MTAPDISMGPDATYGSDRWCAATLGRSYEWFRKQRQTLEGNGFPRRDALLNLTMKADVYAWIAKRRKISDPASAPHTTEGGQQSRENLSAF